MEEIAELVYGSMTGVLIPEVRLDWVENEFLSGKEYYKNYGFVIDTSLRLCERLGVEEDDEDVEAIINMLLVNEGILCRKMFY